MRHAKTHHRVPIDRRSTKAEDAEAIDLGFGRSPRTELGRLLLAARREFFAEEGRFLDRDEIEREVHERRGDLSSDLGG